MKPILYLLFMLNGQQADTSVFVLAHENIYVFNDRDYVKFHVKDTVELVPNVRAKFMLENGWAVITRKKTIIRNGRDEIVLSHGKWDNWTFINKEKL